MPTADPNRRAAPRRSLLRAAGKRLALVVAGVVLAALALELVLGASSLFLGHRSGALPPGSGAVVLTVGDSHTFGVYYPPEKSYPGRLQERLDERSPGAYRVVNRGLPGMNSAEIVTRLPAWSDRYRPRFVVFCAGINNLWNSTDTELDRGRPAWQRWLLATRTARLLRLVALGRRQAADLPADTGRPPVRRVLLDGGRAGVEHRDARTGELLARHEGNIGRRARDAEAAAALLADDLATIGEMARERGFEPILLTYAARPLEAGDRFAPLDRMSDELAAYADRHAVRLVDVRPRFDELLAAADDRTAWFHSLEDGHPNAAGYDEIARLVAEEIAP